MKKTFLLLLTISLGLFLAVGGAAAYTINDNYYGADDHDYGDRIGLEALFEIAGMNVSLSGQTLSVDIYTNYKEPETTFNTHYGDLFISTDGWNPNTTKANYLADNYYNGGERWEYVFDVSAPTLYALPTDSSEYDGAIILSEEVTTSGTFRNGQEVLVDETATGLTDAGGPLGTTSYVDKGLGAYNIYQLRIDLGSLDWSDKALAFHWAPTCANDVIEGAVPLPAAAILLGSGLICLVSFGRRKLFEK